MKFTVWQQFSSNHSADFTLVGKFATAEQAEACATELRNIFIRLGSWWQKQIEQSKKWYEILNTLEENEELTPPEMEIKTQYHLETFQKPLDWVMNPNAAGVVHVFRDLVIVDQGGGPVSNTWNGDYPFNVILERWGGVVTRAVETEDTYLLLNLTCEAPSDEVAMQIYNQLKYYFPSSPKFHLNFPGIDFFEGHLTLKDRQLNFRKLEVHFTPLHETMSKIVGYLENQGCTQISYEFTNEY